MQRSGGAGCSGFGCWGRGSRNEVTRINNDDEVVNDEEVVGEYEEWKKSFATVLKGLKTYVDSVTSVTEFRSLADYYLKIARACKDHGLPALSMYMKVIKGITKRIGGGDDPPPAR